MPDPGVIVLSKHGYCTLAHIEAILPRQPLTSETTVNRARAKAAVQDYFDDINGRLYVLGYDVPVPSTNSTGINRVSHLNMLGAAAEVEMNWHSSVNAENSQLASQLFEQYDEMWDLIEGGRMIWASRNGPRISRPRNSASRGTLSCSRMHWTKKSHFLIRIPSFERR